ncbi:MAG: hypothetical protein EXS15_07180 [Phycisphaerales bacterium]|nr:hypothetical protein [Phycisphaerales bacterium]
MPRSGAFILDEMRSLAKQVSFVPKEAARRQVAAARVLLDHVQPDELYGWSKIVFQITRFKVEERSTRGELQVVGQSLQRDLGELILRLSRRAPELAGTAWTISKLAAEWRVSTRTIHRLRKRGLAACWMERTLCGPRTYRTTSRGLLLAVRRSDAHEFQIRHASALARAAKMNRMTPSARGDILRRASAAAAGGERRVSIAAREIAREMGVSTESVRVLLVRTPSASHGKLVGRGSRSLRHESLAFSAWRRGDSVGELARRIGCSQQSADRLAHRARAQYLRHFAHRFSPESVSIPEPFVREDARSILLGVPSVRTNLAGAHPMTKSHEWLSMGANAPQKQAPSHIRTGGADAAQMMAVRFLHWSARESTRLLPTIRPTEVSLDRIETDLRWARILMRSLLERAMPTINARLKVWSGGDAMRIAPEQLKRILALVGESLVVVIRDSDPAQIASGRVRVDQAVALHLDRRLAAVGPPVKWDSSAQKPPPVRDPIDAQLPWQAPRAPLERRVCRAALEPATLLLWQMRLGLMRTSPDGIARATNPMTIDEIAAVLGKPNSVVARRLAL